MNKSTLTYIFGMIAIIGWVTYLVLIERKPHNAQPDTITIQSIHHEDSTIRNTAYPPFEESESDILQAAQNMSDSDVSASLVVGQGSYDGELLLQLYKNNPTDSLATLVLQYYRQEFMFDDAWSILERHPSLLGSSISRQEAIQLYANTSVLTVSRSDSILLLQQKVNQRYHEKKLSDADKKRYDALSLLRKGQIEDFITQSLQVQDQYYEPARQSILHNQDYVRGQSDVPSYYLQALVGLSLLQHQYIHFAQKVAIDVTKQDPNYILPYQILAYTSFLNHNRDKAVVYIRELLARDVQQRPMYQFMLGVIAYRQGNYQESILYLIGVDDPSLQLDIYRYLVLSYKKIGDWVQVDEQYTKLLQEELTPSDYYSYFYDTYFLPYRTNTSYSLLEENRTLALRYHSSCEEHVDEASQYICDYGEVGQLLVNKQYDQAFKRLLYLAKYYPQSYFFEALGDYYQQQGKKEKAITSYVQAIRHTKDSIERIDASLKIKYLLP